MSGIFQKNLSYFKNHLKIKHLYNIERMSKSLTKTEITSANSNTISSKMSSVENFKSAVIRIRDILRGAGITGMDSMRHICLYLLSRYMTRERAAALGVPEIFSWENLFDTVMNKEGGDQLALDLFCNSRGDCLVNHFDRLFGTQKFSFDLRKDSAHYGTEKDPAYIKHKEILEILNSIDMTGLDYKIDILGYVYEQHLRTGSTAARDLGQFFTDRSICEYMTQLCKPGFKSPGVPESVCDPSMGTGGFLTTFIKYYKNHHPRSPINWSVQQKEIHGYDTDSKVAGVARLNLFMELGGSRCTNLLTRDSLYGDLVQTGYDIILANMPFGLKGLKYTNCCDRVKSLKINGTKSEPLFLQLMMISLNKGGRCAVVVPDGMLINNSNCHNETRKYLLDNFEVKRIIKMKGQFFMNTGIQPSIIFFENTGKPTTTVEFWETEKTEKGGIIEKMITSVPREKIDATSSFDMRRYIDAQKPVVNITDWPIVKLSDIANYQNGKTLASNEKDEDGEYDVMGGGMSYVGKTHAYNREGETISISKSGASAGFVAYHNKKYWAGDCLTIIPIDSSINLKYLYYYLKFNNLTMSNISGSTIPHCKWDDIKDIHIHKPTRAIQDHIVDTFERIYASSSTDLTDTIKLTNKAMDLVLVNPTGSTLEPIVEAQRLIRKSGLMMKDIKTQMCSIINAVNCRGFPIVRLSTVLNIVSGKANKERQDSHPVPYYDSNGVIGYVTEPLYNGEYIITARNLSIGAVHYVNGPFYPSDHTINFTTQDVSILNNKFFYYWLLLNNKVLRDLSSGIKPGIRKSDVAEIKMPLPPIDFQFAVLSRLEALQSQLTALESLQKQSEDNARFILESYLGNSNQSKTSVSDDEDDDDDDDRETNQIVETSKTVKILRKKAIKV